MTFDKDIKIAAMRVDQEKEMFFDAIKRDLESKGLQIESLDPHRPWGGFFVINEKQVQKFMQLFFQDLDMEGLSTGGKLSPKVLVVAPSKRLSWQYHNRRAEIWKILKGTVQVIKSRTDEEADSLVLGPGEYVKLEQGERHRLVGLNDWGIVAEIWQHTDKEQPSDEQDIIRLQDDFGR